MSTVSKGQFFKDVAHEVEMLKKHATQKEINNLNFNVLDGNSPHKCIYGQLTGSCESVRAKKLMDKACVRVVNHGHGLVSGETLLGEVSRTSETYQDIQKSVNGKYEAQMWEGTTRNYKHYSALETYILLKGAKNKNVIAYLRGSKSKLVL